MIKKVIIFDLDGTAVDTPKTQEVSHNLIAEVQRLQDLGCFLCAATGRGWTFARNVLEDLKLTSPCIISGGTQICNPQTGEILWQKTIPEEALQRIIELVDPEYHIIYNDYATEDYYQNLGYKKSELNINESIYFFEQMYVPIAQADELYKRFSNIDNVCCLMVNSQLAGFKDFHFINKEATKEQAIAELLKILGAGFEDTIGIGDGSNDLQLFQGVSFKVAMANAVPKLKEMADLVIGNVANNGLAEYFKTLN